MVFYTVLQIISTTTRNDMDMKSKTWATKNMFRYTSGISRILLNSHLEFLPIQSNSNVVQTNNQKRWSADLVRTSTNEVDKNVLKPRHVHLKFPHFFPRSSEDRRNRSLWSSRFRVNKHNRSWRQTSPSVGRHNRSCKSWPKFFPNLVRNRSWQSFSSSEGRHNRSWLSPSPSEVSHNRSWQQTSLRPPQG